MATQLEHPIGELNLARHAQSSDAELAAKMAKMELKAGGNFKLAKEKKGVQTINNVPVPKDLKELVQMLRKAFADDQVDVNYVKKLMENYKSNPDDWMQFSTYMSDR